MPLALASPPPSPEHESVRVGFFSGSGRSRLPEFRWPLAKWQELAQVLLQSRATEIVLLGKDDGFTVFERDFRSGLPEALQSRVVAAPTERVPDLVSALSGLDVLVTLNTAALHLAHALKLPTVALCGSSLEIWLPEGAHIRLVRDERAGLPPSDQFRHDPLQPSVERIEVPEVCAAIQELMWDLAGSSPA
jgi:ADP-heptose:LPS heptosyltransferase